MPASPSLEEREEEEVDFVRVGIFEAEALLQFNERERTAMRARSMSGIRHRGVGGREGERSGRDRGGGRNFEQLCRRHGTNWENIFFIDFHEMEEE
ncbi:hypothetical protein CEXT_760241 [Caerostris extrusa]|uniref:Uncharacterized protein n=1 Tax=Caerostris extrusa TaxID=172846 RepID=A0AAV4WMX8_CAEEX|nr:hypothetical protein CEXT_760241 [Caerostris extrusa]